MRRYGLEAPAHGRPHKGAHSGRTNRRLSGRPPLHLGLGAILVSHGARVVLGVSFGVRVEATLLHEIYLLLSHLLHILVRLLERCSSSLGLLEYFSRFLQEHFVFLHLLLISPRIQRIQMLKLAHILPLLLVLHLELLLPDGVLLLLTHPRLGVVASEHPPLLLDLLLRLIPHLPLDRQAQEADRVRYQVLLDPQVQRRVRRERGRVVDLEEPGFGVFVQEDVEAEDLEAQAVLQVVWLRCPVGVGQGWLSCYQSLQNDILDALPYFFGGNHGLALFEEVFAVVYGA